MNAPPQTLPIIEALQFGWKRTRENLRPLAYLGLLNLLLAVAQQSTLSGQPARPLLALALQFFQLCVGLIYVRWALSACDGRTLEDLSDATMLRGLLPFVITLLIYSAIVAVGLALLIVPGVVWSLRLAFAPTLVVDKDLDAWDALRESARLTRGVKGRLLGFALLCLSLNIVGSALFGIGLIFTLPMTVIAHVHLLRLLQARAQHADGSRAAPTTLSATSPA
jgi:uncharacterized membrane protein